VMWVLQCVSLLAVGSQKKKARTRKVARREKPTLVCSLACLHPGSILNPELGHTCCLEMRLEYILLLLHTSSSSTHKPISNGSISA
jgi:hypothetical protein